jgi:hypothetical protein
MAGAEPLVRLLRSGFLAGTLLLISDGLFAGNAAAAPANDALANALTIPALPTPIRSPADATVQAGEPAPCGISARPSGIPSLRHRRRP